MTDWPNNDPLRIACPYCGVKPRQWCRVTWRGDPTSPLPRDYHIDRQRKAAQR
jgi:sarcosine oxidase delta subunit